jgi:hypothetical protein
MNGTEAKGIVILKTGKNLVKRSNKRYNTLKTYTHLCGYMTTGLRHVLAKKGNEATQSRNCKHHQDEQS